MGPQGSRPISSIWGVGSEITLVTPNPSCTLSILLKKISTVTDYHYRNTSTEWWLMWRERGSFEENLRVGGSCWTNSVESRSVTDVQTAVRRWEKSSETWRVIWVWRVQTSKLKCSISLYWTQPAETQKPEHRWLRLPIDLLIPTMNGSEIKLVPVEWISWPLVPMLLN